LQRSPRPPSCIQEACILLRGRGGGKEEREERKWEERGGEERGGREFVLCPRKKKKSRRICAKQLVKSNLKWSDMQKKLGPICCEDTPELTVKLAYNSPRPPSWILGSVEARGRGSKGAPERFSNWGQGQR